MNITPDPDPLRFTVYALRPKNTGSKKLHRMSIKIRPGFPAPWVGCRFTGPDGHAYVIQRVGEKK